MTPTRSDGIRTSQRPLGPLAKAWIAALDQVDDRIRTRVARGRTLARGARVKELELAPGAAFGEVRDQEGHRPTLRFRTFEESEWAQVVELLCSRLDLLAPLFEGGLPPELMDLLAARGLPLLPSVREIDGDCDCGDWAVPCAHGAALHHLLGEVLEGEPFLLFTLRGRPRDQLLGDLRRAWGDSGAPRHRGGLAEEPVPDGDPFVAPAPLPSLSFRFTGSGGPPGMVELGPLVGDEDLPRALRPLYDAGAAHAVELALAGEAATVRRASRSRVPGASAPPRAASASPLARSGDLADQLVDLVAESEDGLTAEALAAGVGRDLAALEEALSALERLGSLVRVSAGGHRRYLLG